MSDWLPLGYAFGAGLMAAVNPCGFLMLPSYIAFYLGLEESAGPPSVRTVFRGMVLGLAITAGFIAIFAGIGAVISLGGWALVGAFPPAGLAVGVFLLLLGLWLLLGRGFFGLLAATRLTLSFKGDLRGAFVFGIAYGVVSLGCTLPVFMAVIGSALAAHGLLPAFLQFISYSLGMGFLVAAVITGALFLKGTVERYLRRLIPYLHTLGALFLIGVGVYLIQYWARVVFG